MINPMTLAAIAVLNEIRIGNELLLTSSPFVLDKSREQIIAMLLSAHLIERSCTECENYPSSFVLVREPSHITLLDILVATDGQLDCSKPVDEEFYFRYGRVAKHLGVVNEIARNFLQTITLSDF